MMTREQLVQRAEVLYSRLYKTRKESGKVPKKVKARDIIASFNAPPYNWGLHKDGPQLRQMVHYLRNERNPRVPVGADRQGYWLIVGDHEYDAVLHRIGENLREWAETFRSLKEIREAERKRRDQMFDEPAPPEALLEEQGEGIHAG